MAEQGAGRARPPRGRLALAIFFACFSLFVLNVLLGKAAIVFGWTQIPLLSDVAEFLLLLFAVAVFVVAAIQREQAADPET